MSDISKITDFLELLGDPILFANDASQIIFVNSACAGLFGYTKDQMLKLRIDDLMLKSESINHQGSVKKFIHSNSTPKDMMTRNTIPCVNSKGEAFKSRISIASVKISNELYGVATVQDFTAVQQEISTLESDSNVDVLTNLFNRRYLEEILKPNSRILASWQTVGVLYLDLNQFKPVNDNLGHAAGDSVLKMVANRLKMSVRYDDVIFRMGGDEFLIFINLTNVADKIELLRNISSKIIKLISDPFLLQNQPVYIGVSLGAGIYPDDTDDLRELIHSADKAMYSSKNHSSPVSFVNKNT